MPEVLYRPLAGRVRSPMFASAWARSLPSSGPIDLVIDDASHIYEATLASSEVMFPRLKEGGLLIIEDWAADQWRQK